MTGGVLLTYYGVPPAANSPFTCGNDANGKCNSIVLWYELSGVRSVPRQRTSLTTPQYTTLRASPHNIAYVGNAISRSVVFNLSCTRRLGVKFEIRSVTESSNPPCQYIIQAETPHACGCDAACTELGIITRNCGVDGCGGYCTPAVMEGLCPDINLMPQECVNGQCCRSDCTSRTCGTDGCGGYCGAYQGGCAPGQVCSAAQVCVTAVTPGPQYSIVYTTVGSSFIGASRVPPPPPNPPPLPLTWRIEPCRDT